MSWLDDIIDVGSNILGWFTGNSTGANLARTALAGFTLNQITKSINRDNNSTNYTPTSSYNGIAVAADAGVRLQVDPSPDQKIPVVYGRCALGGIITDAQITNGNQTMYFCLVLCEKTGKTLLGQGPDSEISIEQVYWNNQLIAFKNDGVTADYLIDTGTGETDSNINGLVKIYLYNNGSDNPVAPYSYYPRYKYDARSIMPGWTQNNKMTELVFAIVRVDYSKDKNITALGNMTFVLNNSMTLAGECLYDYMTNKRYGAGIDPTEIYSQ
jgi:hypothetical protein